MGYGHDYKAALKDFTLFAGKMPLPPRYAFGYWWSRYWAYSDNDLRELVDDFQWKQSTHAPSCKKPAGSNPENKDKFQ